VCTHDAGEELHHENLMVEGKSLVIAIEEVIELFSKSLRIIKKLQGRKIGGYIIRFFVMFLGQKLMWEGGNREM
jgi:hypothetical protein